MGSAQRIFGSVRNKSKAAGRWSDRHPVLGAVRTGVLVTFASMFLVALAHLLLPLSFQRAALEWLSATVSVPRSLVLGLAVAASMWPIYGIWRMIVSYRERPAPYESYRTDEFMGLRWRWRWYRGGVGGANAFCPECDIELSPTLLEGDQVMYRCPAGHVVKVLQGVTHFAVGRDVAQLAERNARSGGLLKD